MDFWNRYVEMSHVLSRDEKNNLILQEGAHFVFGGDAVDQAPGDLEFLQEIVDFHHNYPGRVSIILGNRDINKMRLAQELTAQHQKMHPWSTYRGVFWRGDAGLDHDEADTLPNRLRWILQNTMGSGRSFELRRQELGGDNVTDDMVVHSFHESLQPNGAMREYLKVGKLGVVLGDTLFVHGGLSKDVMGWIPQQQDEKKENNARTWISKLNIFCKLQVEEFFRDMDDEKSHSNLTGNNWAMSGGYGTLFPGGDLMQYGMGWLPNLTRNNTVIYRDWFQLPTAAPPSSSAPPDVSRPTLPRPPESSVVEYLKSSKIKRVVCGHKPHGDACLIVKSQGDEVCVVTLDTSYSGQVQVVAAVEGDDQRSSNSGSDHSTNDNKRRGCAVSELLVYFEENESSRAVVHGIDSFGNEYVATPDDDSSLVGRISNVGGWIVKGERKKDQKLILGRLVGWNFENMYVDKQYFVEEMIGSRNAKL